jgi:hypothetical protein
VPGLEQLLSHGQAHATRGAGQDVEVLCHGFFQKSARVPALRSRLGW